MHRSYLAFSCVFVLAALSSCAAPQLYEPPARVRWADDAGSVTVAPISVTRWEDVASDLQPKFKMDSDVALALAMPTTQTLDERFSDALAASVGLALPTNTVSSSRVSATNPDTGEIETSVSRTRTRASGDVSDIATPTPPAATAAGLAALVAGKIDRDPMLRYLAATALQQEVALLNRYVTDKIQVPGAQAFLVRLQVSVMPNRRGMPYDVFTDITLHAGDQQAEVGLAEKYTEPNASKLACRGDSFDTLSVVPMVVTDNLEGLQASRTTDVARQIALSLIASAAGVGARGDLARTTETLRSTQGNDANSLLTVGKLTDDTVRVRLGAAQSPRYQYATIPRTHNISLLVIYRPCIEGAGAIYETSTPRVITAIARTEFRDALSGNALPYQDRTNRLINQMGWLRHKYPGRLTYLDFVRLFQWSSRQDQKSFFGYMDRMALRSSQCNRSLGNAVRQLMAGDFYPKGKRSNLFERQMGNATLRERFMVYLNLMGESLLSDARPIVYLKEEIDPPYAEKETEAGLSTVPDPACVQLEIARYRTVASGLWTDLQALRPLGEFAFTRVPLKLRTAAIRYPANQTALVTLSAASTSTALYQGEDLALLKKKPDMMLVGADLDIAATEVTTGADGRSISAKFPALNTFGVSSKDTAFNLKLVIEADDKDACDRQRETVTSESAESRQVSKDTASFDATRKTCTIRYKVKLDDSVSPTAPPVYKLAASASGIIAGPDGNGKLIVTITPASKAKQDKPASAAYYLRVVGADVTNVTGGNVASDENGRKITGPGEFVLSLSNLIPNQQVTIALEGVNGESAPPKLEKTVIAGAAEKKS